MIRSCCSLTIVVPCLFIFFIAAGCAPPFPKETLDKVNRNVTFLELKKDPEKFKGTLVMFGGSRLPEVARSLGKSINEFKKGIQEGGKDDTPDSKNS